MPRPTRPQINIKLNDQDSILVECFRDEATIRGWGFKQAVLDALANWLENPPQQPPTRVDSLVSVIPRLEAIEAKLKEIGDYKPESLSPTVRSTVEQLRERTSNQSQAIARLQQEVLVLKEQVSGLEAAVIALASPPESETEVDITFDSTSAITPSVYPSKKPCDLTLEEIEKLSPWKQWEAVCTDMIDGLKWEDLGNGGN